MTSDVLDCLVVGQGLAGTCMAHHLYRQDKTFLVIDYDNGKKCSAVAAGTFNPIAFKTLSNVWMAEKLLPEIKTFYKDVETLTKSKLLVERKVLRRFRNEDQRQQWEQELRKPEKSPFLGKISDQKVPGVQHKFGFGEVVGAGGIRMMALLKNYRDFLKEEGRLIEASVTESSFDIDTEMIRFGKIRARNLILCQGHEALNNQFFSTLPIWKTKGEVMIIRCELDSGQNIVHDGINIVPIDDGLFWAGSTFDWKDGEVDPTEEGKEKLCEALEKLIDVPYEIIDHWAGIRPTVTDRRPIAGQHPDFKRVFICNGLGARGVMTAPYVSRVLLDYIFNGHEIPKDINIQRFISAT